MGNTARTHGSVVVLSIILVGAALAYEGKFDQWLNPTPLYDLDSMTPAEIEQAVIDLGMTPAKDDPVERVVTVDPENPFASRDQSRVCGAGFSSSCMSIPVPGQFEMPGSAPRFTTAADKKLCAQYYEWFTRTGRVDAEVDSHCYARWQTPYMVPDTTR